MSNNNSFRSQVKTIQQAYNAIPELQDGFYDVKDRLLEMNLDAERQHRRGHPPTKLSAIDAARYFVVRHLLDGFAEPNKFSVDDILCIRNEVLYAQAYAKKHRTELKQWADKYALIFKMIDYAELMK